MSRALSPRSIRSRAAISTGISSTTAPTPPPICPEKSPSWGKMILVWPAPDSTFRSWTLRPIKLMVASPAPTSTSRERATSGERRRFHLSPPRQFQFSIQSPRTYFSSMSARSSRLSMVHAGLRLVDISRSASISDGESVSRVMLN